MGMNDLYHELNFELAPFAGAAPQITCTDFAAFNTQFATALDTAGYEANMFVLYFSHINNATVYTFQMFESDASAVAAGTAVAAADVLVRRDDGDVTDCPVATGILTMAGAVSEHHFYTFQYTGRRRWIHMVCGGGTGEDFTPGMITIQAKGRREPANV